MANCYWVLADKVLISFNLWTEANYIFGIPHKLNWYARAFLTTCCEGRKKLNASWKIRLGFRIP